jgi:regulator of sigma E protease
VPRAGLQVGWVRMPSGKPAPVQHLLGLTPVMRVGPDAALSREKPADRQGLTDGDIFARLASVEFPSITEGIGEVHRHKGEAIPVVVLRREDGSLKRVALNPTVRREGEGRIGFVASDTSEIDTLVSLPVPLAEGRESEARRMPAASLITRPGTRILSIAGAPVRNFAEMRSALQRATAEAIRTGAASASIPVELGLPLSGGGAQHPVERGVWTLSSRDLKSLHALTEWVSPLDPSSFEPKVHTVQASGPIDAIGMGLHKTQRVMMSTYLTFARLFEGTVKVEHLKGPVGIAHMGTRIAERGLAWLLFFMALISVNLAVINFLPLPIVDGGQFIFLVLEQIRGKPVSVEVQNVATVLGLVLIGAVFLVVTFHDIAGLFAG